MEFYLYSLYVPWSGQAEIFLQPFVGNSNERLEEVEIELGTFQTRKVRPDQTRQQTAEPQNVFGTSACVYEGRPPENRRIWFRIAGDWAFNEWS
jgi:hypothetical protein